MNTFLKTAARVYCIIKYLLHPGGNEHLLSSSLVAPFWRRMKAERIIQLVSSQCKRLAAEQGVKALWMASDFL